MSVDPKNSRPTRDNNGSDDTFDFSKLFVGLDVHQAHTTMHILDAAFLGIAGKQVERRTIKGHSRSQRSKSFRPGYLKPATSNPTTAQILLARCRMNSTRRVKRFDW